MPSGLVAMSPAIFEAARVFPCDISRPEGLEANSIFDPNLYEVYLADLGSSPAERLDACRTQNGT